MAKKKAAAKKPATTPPTKATKGGPKRPPGATGAGAGAPSQDELASAWGKSRTQDPRGAGEPPDIPDGDYPAQITSARAGKYKTGDRKDLPYFTINYVIVAGPYTGTRVQSRDDLDSTRQIGQTGQTALDLFRERLQRLLGTEFVENLDFKDIVAPRGLSNSVLGQRLSDPQDEIGKLYVAIHVQNRFVPAAESRDQRDHRYQGVYINNVLSDEDIEALQDELGTGDAADEG